MLTNRLTQIPDEVVVCVIDLLDLLGLHAVDDGGAVGLHPAPGVQKVLGVEGQGLILLHGGWNGGFWSVGMITLSAARI